MQKASRNLANLLIRPSANNGCLHMLPFSLPGQCFHFSLQLGLSLGHWVEYCYMHRRRLSLSYNELTYQVQEITIEYTNCITLANSTNFTNIPDNIVSTAFSSNSTNATPPQWQAIQQVNTDLNITEDVCQIQFTLPTDFTPPVMLYYRLTGFYQNHRRYVKSVDQGQLNGQDKTAEQLHKDGGCVPLTLAPSGKPYYPCGLIANSLFNGTFPLYYLT
jgi:LEM3 (ligand-effect modulator 3) family / CDC50 family